MSRLPEPSPPDVCDACGQNKPLFRLYGRGGDHVHRCPDCLRSAVAGELMNQLRRERDEARTWAREMWVTSGPPWLRNRPELGPAPGWLTARKEQL